ncbi:MAG: winged helix-turn-helix transcriptional regulator [Candidatus Thorarchaeota archaeon]
MQFEPVEFMTATDDNTARMTLRIAGVYQEIRDIWAKRLDKYFTQIESLIDGQWLETEDILGIIKESRLASREALDGLGSDLSSELVHASNGIVARYEAMRSSLVEEIVDLRNEISNLTSGDENSLRRENIALKDAVFSVPEFKLLQVIQKHRRTTYDQLCNETSQKKSVIRKLVKALMSRGYINIDKKARPHAIVYLFAPWNQMNSDDQQILDQQQSSPYLRAQAEHR